MKQFVFYLWVLSLIGLVTGCQVTEFTTPTATVISTQVSQIVVQRPSPTLTNTPTPQPSLTAVPSPTNLLTSTTTTTPFTVPLDEPTTTPSPIPTATRILPTRTPNPTTTPTATPLPRLPTGLPQIDVSWTGIGTAVPPAFPISTANVSGLVEVARWGKGQVLQALYSPDGRYLYARTPQGIYLYDAATAQQLDFRPYAGTPGSMALSPDGKILAVAMNSYPHYVELRDAQTNDFIAAFFPFEDANVFSSGLNFDQSSEILFVSYASHEKATIVAWDIVNLVPVTTLENARSFDLAPQVQIAATINDGYVQLWQWQNRSFTALHTLAIPDVLLEAGTVLTISPDGQYVALGQSIYYMAVAVWRISDGELLHLFEFSRPRRSGKRTAVPLQVSGSGRQNIEVLQFSPDSQLLAATTGYQTLLMWQVESGQLVHQLDEVGDRVIFSPDGTTVATWQDTLSQWRVNDGSFINVLNQHIGYVSDLVLIPQRNQLAIASYDRFVYIRRLSDGALATSLRAGISNNNSLADPYVTEIGVTADGNTLVSASNDAYRIWNIDDYSMITLQPTPRDDIGPDGIAVSFDGQYVLGREHDYEVSLWQAPNWEHSFIPFYTPQTMAFSPTELVLATDGGWFGDQHNLLWRPDTQELQTLPLDPTLPPEEMGWVQVFSFSDNGRFLAGGMGNKTLVWAVDGLEAALLYNLIPSADSRSVHDIVFSPDNKILAVSNIANVKFWDLTNGTLLFTLNIPMRISSLLFTEDGRYLITGHEDGSVRFWGIP